MKEQEALVSLDFMENLFRHYVVRDRKHAESFYKRCKGESLYIKLYFAPDSLHSFSLL